MSGGTIRGFSHIGVLKVLERHKIPIHFLTGISAGSIVSALYASGLTANQIEKVAFKIKWHKIVSFTISNMGLVSSSALGNFLVKNGLCSDFQNLKIPLHIFATNVQTGQRVDFNKGSVVDAVRASCQFPGIFAPLEEPNQHIYDGGLYSNINVSGLLEMGADVTIAVDVLPHRDVECHPHNIIQINDRSVDLILKRNSQNEKDLADVVIEPVTDEIYSLDIHKIRQLIDMGEEATKEALPLIKEIIK